MTHAQTVYTKPSFSIESGLESRLNLAGPHSMKGDKGSCSLKCTKYVCWTLPLPTGRTSSSSTHLCTLGPVDHETNIHLGSEHSRRILRRSALQPSPANFKIMPPQSRSKPPWKPYKPPIETMFWSCFITYIGPAWKPTVMVDAVFRKFIYLFFLTRKIHVHCKQTSLQTYTFL